MLGQLIGEDIDLAWQPSFRLWPVKMKRFRTEQILANLCINPRDAINGMGKLTIKTGTKTFKDQAEKNHRDLTRHPGAGT